MSIEWLDSAAKEVLKDYPELSYDLSKSTKSCSLYLYITDGVFKRSIRVSDHKNGYNYYLNKEIVSDKFNRKCIRRTIANQCKALRMARKFHCFDIIERQLSQSYAGGSL